MATLSDCLEENINQCQVSIKATTGFCSFDLNKIDNTNTKVLPGEGYETSDCNNQKFRRHIKGNLNCKNKKFRRHVRREIFYQESYERLLEFRGFRNGKSFSNCLVLPFPIKPYYKISHKDRDYCKNFITDKISIVNLVSLV